MKKNFDGDTGGNHYKTLLAIKVHKHIKSNKPFFISRQTIKEWKDGNTRTKGGKRGGTHK